MASRAHLPALTGLRFIAAFYVVLYHAFQAPPPGDPEHTGPLRAALARAFDLFCSHGFVAVSFFFTLSGFIVAYNYPADTSFDAATFQRARFARIYPVYLLGLLVALPVLIVHTIRDQRWAHAGLECALALTLMQAWLPSFWNAVNAPGWSLSVEAFFYALYPRLVGPLTRTAATRGGALAALAALYFCALSGAALGTWNGVVTRTDTSLLANFFRYVPPLALPQFAFGVVLGHMHTKGLGAPRLIASVYYPSLILLGWALCSDAIPYLFLHNGALLPLFAAIILYHADDSASWLGRRSFTALGEASYALYMLHLPVWGYVKATLERTGRDPFALWVFPAYALLTIAVSLIVFAWFEVPARRWLMSTAPRRELDPIEPQ
jgi:peptidoglycan/LPS O-acetylase OafA/YrhL